MQPVMYSTKEAKDGQPGWERTGSNVCYYKNFYLRKIDGLSGNKYYFTTTFTIRFPHADDVCYLAYHYPYTYSMLKVRFSSYEFLIFQGYRLGPIFCQFFVVVLRRSLSS